MARKYYSPENRYHAPLSEKMEDELIGAIRRNQQDSQACREELWNRGWKDPWIDDQAK